MSVLADIVTRKRADVVERQGQEPLETFRDSLSPSDRSLAAALARPHLGMILECKRASPSAGRIREDYDPAAIARDYAPFADAISVLCDMPYFEGSLAHLGAVRAAAPCPALGKDFVVDPYQVHEARRHGADAVLLMLSVLEDEAWRACAVVAAKLCVDTLTEVHDEPELRRALALDAPIIGINNRNLKTLEVDLSTTGHLAPLVPGDRLVVCESGIRDHADLRRLRGAVNAFLIGSSLMRQPPAELPRAVRELVFGRVKVCGLTRPEDARTAWETGATFGGLIFAKGSPRRVTREKATVVREAAPLRWVAVTVGSDPAEVVSLAGSLNLAAVQLHGDEDAEYIARLREHLPAGCEIWKAQQVRSVADVTDVPGADRILLDTYRADLRGGTGDRFDWRGLDEHPLRDRLILAGGLNPENAAQADALGCWGLDVNSGVEVSPGIKDAARLRTFFTRLRGEDTRGQTMENP